MSKYTHAKNSLLWASLKGESSEWNTNPVIISKCLKDMMHKIHYFPQFSEKSSPSISPIFSMFQIWAWWLVSKKVIPRQKTQRFFKFLTRKLLKKFYWKATRLSSIILFSLNSFQPFWGQGQGQLSNMVNCFYVKIFLCVWHG